MRLEAVDALSRIVYDWRPQIIERIAEYEEQAKRPWKHAGIPNPALEIARREREELDAENGPGGVEDRRALVLQRAAPALVRTLWDAELTVARRAHAVLQVFGATVLTLVTPVLDRSDREPRRLALSLLGYMGREAEPALPKIYAILQGEDSELQLVARIILAQIGHGSRDPNQLAAELKASESGRAVAAGAELRRLKSGAETVVPALGDVLDDPSSTTAARREASLTLTALGAAAAPVVPALCRVAKRDGDAEVRTEAIRAIAATGRADQLVLTTLAAAVDDPDPGPCQASMAALAQIGPPAVSVLSWALTHPRPAVADLAAKALGDMGQLAAPAKDQLIRALENPKAFWYAIRALINIGADPAITLPPLHARLSDPVGHQRRGAVNFLALLGAGASSSFEAVYGLMNDSDQTVVAAVPAALAQIDPRDDRTEQACIAAMRSSEYWVRAGGVEGVRVAGPAVVGAVSALVKVGRAVRANKNGDPHPPRVAIEAVGKVAIPVLDKIAADVTRPELERETARAWSALLRDG